MRSAMLVILVTLSAAATAGGSALAAPATPLPGTALASNTDARDCSVAETRRLVGRFIRAFNEGSTARLDRIFAPAGSFGWYSTDAPGRRLGTAAYDRSTLIRYFAARHAQRERLLLRRWQGNGNANGYSHFQFRLVRQARDLQPAGYEGKGAIVCSSSRNTIAVWSMARRS